MKPLFAREGLMILESLSFTRTLYAFDFDGTLSKIVRVPGDATLSRTTESLLVELAGLAPVAVISGRSIDDLKPRLKFKPHFLVGNHGLEGLEGGQGAMTRARSACLGWKKTLDKVDWPHGVEIEDKTYSLAIHFRRSRNKKTAKVLIRDSIEALSPSPRIIAGKSVLNLLPAGAPHKGIALMEIMKSAGFRNAFYIGDDDTDEDVFSLQDEGRLMTVRVGKKRSSNARYFIARQSEINRLLKELIRHHRPEPTKTKDRTPRR